MTTAIWWIRRDLRLTDNPALHAALQHAERIIPLFILDDLLLNASHASEKRIAFLMDGLRALDADLRALGSRLIVRKGAPLQILRTLVQETEATAIYAHQDYSPYATQRDGELAAQLPIHFTDGVAIRSPGSVLKKDGLPYTVFTPYSRQWKNKNPITRSDILPSPRTLKAPPKLASEPLATIPQQGSGDLFFPSGEAEAKRRLGDFCGGDTLPIFDYARSRDRPDLSGTAQLSPYLKFGMISPRLAALGAFEAMEKAHSLPQPACQSAIEGAKTWLSELIWRDFYIGILAQFPHVRRGSFRPVYDNIIWHNDENAFEAWCQGQTGYPFIDAAMRQLKTTGWMHNRARMAVASFLVKDLLIDWRWGERWFMQQLLDGDPAANNGGWQWAAGTGTDAAPYFRIFNPISQGTKFDPNGDYVRQWVPELANVPQKFLHSPWQMAEGEQIKSRCQIGFDYPGPIVDHKWARERVLAAYKRAKDSEGA